MYPSLVRPYKAHCKYSVLSAVYTICKVYIWPCNKALILLMIILPIWFWKLCLNVTMSHRVPLVATINHGSSRLSRATRTDSGMEIWARNAHWYHSSALQVFKTHSEQCTINIPWLQPSGQPTCPTLRPSSHSWQKWSEFHQFNTCSWACPLSGWDPGETLCIPRCQSIDFNDFENTQSTGSYTQGDCEGGSQTRWTIEGYMADWHGSVWPSTTHFHWWSRSWQSHKHLKEGMGSTRAGLCMPNKLLAWTEVLCSPCA